MDFEVFHPSSINILIKVHQFFSRNDLGYLECQYNLRNAKGKYEKVAGVTRTIAWNEGGAPLYALSVTCRESEYTLALAKEHFAFVDLSPRENEVLACLLQGYANCQIADELEVSEKTIEKNVSTLFQKAKVKNRPDFFASLNQIL